MAEDVGGSDRNASIWGNTFPTPLKGRSRGREADGVRGEEDCSELWREFVNRSSYTEVGRMRRELGRSFREGLVRHGGDKSCRGIAGDSVGLEGTSSTVWARERGGVGAGCVSILLSLEAAAWLETETMEEAGLEGGRWIR